MLDILSKRSKPFRYQLDRLMYSMGGFQTRVASWKSAYANKPLLIVGNGPSLRETPLDIFKDVASIGMNKIDLLFHKVEWRPSVITCVNGIVMNQHKSVFENCDIPLLLGFKSWWFGIRGENIAYILEKAGSDFSNDLIQGVGSSGTVTYTAMQLAYFFEANPIILFGVDHNFVVEAQTRPNKITKMKSEDINHFDPNYFAKGSYWGVPNIEKSEIAYRNAKSAFDQKGVRVYDATIGGKLDIFPKISVNQAIDLCGLL